MASTVIKKPYKKRDITIRFIPNLLADEGRKLKSLPYNRTWSIRQYLETSGFEFLDMRVTVNGRDTEDISAQLTIGDDILISPKIETPIALWWAAATFWQGVAFVAGIAATVATVGFAIYQSVAAARLKTPNYGSDGEGLDEGPGHTWDGVRTTCDVGGVIPVCYGEVPIGGNVINEYISHDGDESRLHTLLGICWGEIESIILRRINRNPAENYSGYTLTTRLGTLDQLVIPGFHDSHNLVGVDVQLVKDSAYTYTTNKTDVEAFELHFKIPGLYTQESNGNILSWAITYKVEYKLHTDVEWTDLGSQTITRRTRNNFKSVFRKDSLTSGQCDIRITRTSDDPSDLDFPITNGELWLERVDEISCEDAQEFPRIALAAIDSLAIRQLSGTPPDYELLVKGRKVMTPQVMNGAEAVPWDDYYWDPLEEAYRLFSDDTILTWDGETFVTAYSANPIWCTYDLMTNTVFGAGHYITPSDNNIAFLVEQSQYCDEKVPDGAGGWEKRFRMDIRIESPQKALNLILQMCSLFRAYPFYSDRGQVKIVVEKPEEPVQLFSPGNIAKNSFSESWGSKRDIPTIVNVQFDDKDRDFTPQTVQAVVDDEALIAGRPLNPVTIRYYGVKESYAIRHGRNYYKSIKYISNTIRFKSALGGMLRQCGEVIDIAHDVPQWGFGGTVKADFVYRGNFDEEIAYAVNDGITYEGDEYRCIQASTGNLPTEVSYWEIVPRTKVKLDRTVTIETGKSYCIRVDFARGGYEEGVVIDNPGTYTEVNVATAFSNTPMANDIYSFGEIDKVVKPGRIIAIKRSRNGEVEFEVPEYSGDIFDDTAVTIPQKKISSLVNSILPVENLKLTGHLVEMSDGKIEMAIDVWFTKPEPESNHIGGYCAARIYLSDNDGDSWDFRGETLSHNFQIAGGIVDGKAYRVAVTSVGLTAETPVSTAPNDTITPVRKGNPNNVASFIATKYRDRMVYGWPEVSDLDVRTGGGYEIRSGESWEAGRTLITRYKGTRYEDPNFREGTDLSFWIKAINSSGNYSLEATEAIVTVDNIPFKNIIASYSEAPGWAGEKTNTTAAEGTLEISEGELTGTYETPVRDNGYVASFKIGIEEIVTLAAGDRTFDSDANARFNDNVTDRFSGPELPGASSFRIRTSEDNVTWSEWASWQAGDYYCRYFQLEMTLTRENLSQTIQCSQLDYYADLPDVDDRLEGEVTVAGDGDDLTFVKTFHEDPALNITILTGDGVYWKQTGLDTTGCNIKLYDASGTAVTGTFRAHIHGV